MSRTIDEKVVEMRFDNRNFERNVEDTLQYVERLNKGLKFEGASKGLEEVNAAAKKMDMGKVEQSVDAVITKIKLMASVSEAMIQRMTNAIIDFGKKTVDAFAIEPVTTGFNEYELKMGSVQTIMAATGASVQTVNKYLDELNEYSDRTIYSFSDMTNNIGKFTNAGVSLKDSVAAIKGISNEAALAGANANEASRAMYNFAQALATGSVKLIDWKSIENANMATVSFKEELLKTAAEMGTVSESANGMYQVLTKNGTGSNMKQTISATRNFNDSLAYQWMTSEVLIETLKKYSDETTKIGQDAYAAAQDVKTFSMMVDTLKEAAQSGWAETWQYIIGDFEEAKKTWTTFTEFFSDIISNSAKARNELVRNAMMLQNDEGLSGREALWQSLLNVLENARNILGAVKKAWEEIFPPMTDQKLRGIIESIKNFTERIKLSDDQLQKLQRTFKGIFAILDIFVILFRAAFRVAIGVAKALLGVLETLFFAGFSVLVDWLNRVQTAETGFNGWVNGIIKGVKRFIEYVKNLDGLTLTNIFKTIASFVTEVLGSVFNFDAIVSVFNEVSDRISGFFERLSGSTRKSTDDLKQSGNGLVDWLVKAKDKIVEIFKSLAEHITIDKIIGVAVGVGLAIILFNFNSFIKAMTEVLNGIKSVFSGISNVLKAVATEIKRSSLAKLMLSFSASILILVGSLAILVALTSNKERFFTALAVLGALVAGIVGAMFALSKIDNKKSVAFAAVIVAFGIAIGSLANALSTIQSISKEGIYQSLLILTIILGELLAVGVLIGSTKKQYSVSALTLVGFALSLSIIVDTLKKIDDTSLNNSKRSLKLLLEVVAIMAILGVAFKNVKMGAAFTLLAGVLIISQITKAMSAFASIDTDGIKKALLSIMAVFGMFAGLMIVAGIVTTTLDNFSVTAGKGVKLGLKANNSVKQLASAVLAISVSLAIVALTFKMIGSLEDTDVQKSLKFISGVALAFAAVIAVSSLAGRNADKAGTMLNKMASAILKLSIVMIALSMFTNPGDLDEPLRVITSLMAVMAVMVLATALVPDTENVIKVFKSISTAVTILAVIVAALSFLPNAEGLKRATIVLTALMGVFALLIASTHFAEKATSTILMMNVSLVVMTSLLIILSEMHVQDALKNAGALAILITSMAAAMFIIGKIENVADGKTLAAVLAMAAIMSALGAAVGFLESINLHVSIQNAINLGILIAELAASLLLLSKVEEVDYNAIAQVGFLAIIMMSLNAIIGALQHPDLDIKVSIDNAIALGILIAELAASLLLLSKVEEVDYSTIAQVGFLALIMMSLNAVIGALQHPDLNIKVSIDNAIALGILIAELAASLLLLSKVEGVSNETIAQVGFLALIVIALDAVIGALQYPDLNIKVSIDNAIALGVLIASISASMKLLNGVQTTWPTIAMVAVMAAIVAGLMAVIQLITSKMGEVKLGIETAASLSVLLIGMSAACVVAAGIGAVAVPAIAGTVVLAAFIAAMGLLMWGIGEMVRENPTILEDLDFAIQVFEKMGEAFGAQIGGFIKGISDNIDFSIFEKIGQDLANCIDAVKPALVRLNGVPVENFEKLKYLVQSILAITANDALQKMTSFWAGKSSLEDFGEQLEALAEGLVKFSEVASGVRMNDHVDGALNLLADLIALGKKVPNTGGILGGIVGNNDLDDFAAQFEAVASGIHQFSSMVSGMTFNNDKIDSALSVLYGLIKLGQEVPNTGGILGLIVGNNDLDDFADQFGAVAEGINTFCTKVSGLPYYENKVNAALYIVRQLVDIAQDIPNEGVSWVSMWVGDNRIEDFAAQFPMVGQGVAAFCASVYSMYYNKERTEAALKVVEYLARIANDIPNQGTSWVSMWVGDNKIQDFAVQFPYVGWGIASFCSYISGYVKQGDEKKAKVALDIFQKVVEASRKLDSRGGMKGFYFGEVNLKDFGAQLTWLGKYLHDYSTWIAQISNMDAVEKSAEIIVSLSSLVDAVKNMDYRKFKTFQDSLQAFALTSLADFAKAFGDADTRTIGIQLSQGITQALHETQGRFIDEGKYLVTGFLNGIEIKMNEENGVAAAGHALASTFLQGLYGGLDEHSPSGKTQWAGEMAILGFMDGLQSDKYSVREAGITMGSEMVEGVQDRLGIHSHSRVGDWIGQMFGAGINDGQVSMFDTITSNFDKLVGNLETRAANGRQRIADAFGGKGFLDLSAGLGDNIQKFASWLGDVTGIGPLFGEDGLFHMPSMDEMMDEVENTVSSITGAFDTALSDSAGKTSKQSASEIMEALKLSMHKHFDSKEFEYLGQQIGEGMMIATNNAIVSEAKATSALVDEIIEVSAQGLDTWKAWLETRKAYDQVAQTDELAGWIRIQQMYVEGTKERMEADQQVYNLQKELVKGTYEYSKKWIDNEKYYERLSLEEELAAWERIQARYMEGSEQRIEAEKELYRIRKEIRQKEYEDAKKWIDREKKFDRLSLADELAAYIRIRNTTTEGSDERLEMDEKVYDLQKQIYEAQMQYTADVEEAQREAAEERVRLEQEYADKVKSINEKLASDIAQLNENYANQVDQRKKSLYSAYGLFDAVEQQDYDKDELMRNLEDQVRAFEEWQMTLNNLAARGLDKGLIDELTEMGPSAAGQLRALNDMTDAELDQYNLLWSEKSMLAREQAISELEELRIETSDNIAQLQQESAKELDEYRKTWADSMAKITANCEERLAQLKQTFGETVGTIKKDTEGKMREMAAVANQILREAGWTETGERIVEGVISGLTKKKKTLVAAVTSIAAIAVAGLNTALRIKSPSKVTEETGEYAGEGLIRGLESYYDKAFDSGNALGENIQNGAYEAVKYVNDLMQNGMDSTFTITPVVDMSNVQSSMSGLDTTLNTRRTVLMASSANLQLDQSRDISFVNPNENVVRELQDLRKDLSSLGEKVANMQLVMDTGAVVGEITPSLDAALGSRIIRNTRERG